MSQDVIVRTRPFPHRPEKQNENKSQTVSREKRTKKGNQTGNTGRKLEPNLAHQRKKLMITVCCLSVFKVQDIPPIHFRNIMAIARSSSMCTERRTNEQYAHLLITHTSAETEMSSAQNSLESANHTIICRDSTYICCQMIRWACHVATRR